MKKIISALLSAAAVLGTLGALALIPMDNEAQARGTGGRGHSSGARSSSSHSFGSHSFSRGARVGVFVGAPIIASPWLYSYPYYGYGAYPYYTPPVAYVQEQPAVYMEQQAPVEQAAPGAPAVQSQQYWYYCQDSQTYFPYVKNCATPWQRVTPYALQ